MVIALLFTLLLTKPPKGPPLTPSPVLVTFPDRPIQTDVEAGAALFLKHRSEEQLFQPETLPIGKWFDGHWQRPIEIAVFLSPSLVSRRLGYLQAREGWTNDQLETRWQLARETLGGRLSFLVRVCSFPKIDLLEEAPAENGPIGQLTPVLVVDGEKGFPLESIVLEDRHGFDTEDVLTPWTSNPRLASFMGAKDELYVPSPVNGDLEAETLLLQAPSIPVRSLSVVLSSHGKTRQADFSPIDPGLPTRRHR